MKHKGAGRERLVQRKGRLCSFTKRSREGLCSAAGEICAEAGEKGFCLAAGVFGGKAKSVKT